MPIKVKAIIGSTSSASYNLKVVEFMRKRYADRLEIMPVFILLPQNEVYIGAVHEKLDGEGNLTDEATVAFLDVVVDRFITFFEKEKAAAN